MAAVFANAKIWSILLQMVLLTQYQVESAKHKRTPYSVQESSNEYSSLGGGHRFAFEDFGSGGGGGGHFIKSRGGFGGDSGIIFGGHFGGLGQGGGHFGGLGQGGGHFGGLVQGGGLSHGAALDGGAFESHGEILQGSYGGGGDDSGDEHGEDEEHDTSHLELSDDALYKIKTLMLESKINQKIAAEKIEKMLKAYGYGTFGYQGYHYPKFGPIDLGTHKGVDLGTTLDSHAIKDPHGNIKLPVQTVLVTNTLGVPIPEPYPVKHEVPVAAPYPVPVPQHSESYPSSYASDYSGDFHAKASYVNTAGALGKVVTYHEGQPDSGDKLESASNNYARYLPSPASSSSAYRTASKSYSSPKKSVYEFK